MRTTIVLILVAAAALAYGKLPPQSDAAKAQAAQTAAKAAWDDKVSLYKTCPAARIVPLTCIGATSKLRPKIFLPQLQQLHAPILALTLLL